MVKEASSSVMTPTKIQGAWSDSAREGSTPGATAKTSELMSAGVLEKRVENSEVGPGQAWAKAIRGWGNLMIPSTEVGVKK